MSRVLNKLHGPQLLSNVFSIKSELPWQQACRRRFPIVATPSIAQCPERFIGGALGRLVQAPAHSFPCNSARDGCLLRVSEAVITFLHFLSNENDMETVIFVLSVTACKSPTLTSSRTVAIWHEHMLEQSVTTMKSAACVQLTVHDTNCHESEPEEY